MTAIVGALNKKGVAVAADSAVTMGNGKVINTAQKIFQLKSQESIGVAIYGNGQFMGVPLKVLISLFDRYCEHSNYQSDTILDCSYMFYNFLVKEKQTNLYRASFDMRLKKFINFFQEKNSSKNKTDEDIENDKKIIKSILKKSNEVSYILNELNLVGSSFINRWTAIIQQDLASDDSENDNELVSGKEADLIAYFLYENGYTGITFFGYGKDDAFPELISYKLYFKLDNFLVYLLDDKASIKISHERGGDIQPFAQADVINNLITGISDDFQDNLLTSVTNELKLVLRDAEEQNGLQDENAKDTIKSLAISALRKLNEHIIDVKNKNTEWVRMTVSYLDIEDLAEYVESLIYVTYLSRRTTSQKEGVGGAVDVATITLDEGFRWVKHKKFNN